VLFFLFFCFFFCRGIDAAHAGLGDTHRMSSATTFRVDVAARLETQDATNGR